MVDIVIVSVILAIVALIICRAIKRKQGSCGCGCSNCANADACIKDKQKKK